MSYINVYDLFYNHKSYINAMIDKTFVNHIQMMCKTFIKVYSMLYICIILYYTFGCQLYIIYKTYI